MKKLFLLLSALMLLSLACQATSSIMPTATLDTATLFPPTETPASLPTAEQPAPVLEGFVRVDAPQIRWFDMVDEQNGWATAVSGVLKTGDGGLTWFNVPLPGNPEPGRLTLHVQDADHAWVLAPDPGAYDSGTLYHTTDGGATWQSNPVPFAGGIIDFPIEGDFNQGWVMADLGVGAGSMAVAIFQTRDAGLTWERVFTNDPTLPGSGDTLPMSGLKNTFAAYDMQTAFIGGYVPAPATLYFFATYDGGKNWQEIIIPAPAELANSEFSVENGPFFTGNTAYLPVRVTGDSPRLVFYFTNDEGKTWSLLPGMVANGIRAQFFTAADGFAFDGGRFYYTNNSALDWTPTTPNVDFSQSFGMMDFVWVETGWVLAWNADGSQTSLYKTSDGGATWQILE